MGAPRFLGVTVLMVVGLSACHSTRVPERSGAPARLEVPPVDTAGQTVPPCVPPADTLTGVTAPTAAPAPAAAPATGTTAAPAFTAGAKADLKPGKSSRAGAASSAGDAAASGGSDALAQAKAVADSVTSVLGKKVQGTSGVDLGRVVDVLADTSGRVRLAVIEYGGFLGVGNRRVAVDWTLLHFHPGDEDRPLVLNLSEKQLRETPDYAGKK